MIVDPVTCLLNESRRKTIGIGFVVSKLRVHKVVDLHSVSLCGTFSSLINTYVPLQSLTISWNRNNKNIG